MVLGTARKEDRPQVIIIYFPRQRECCRLEWKTPNVRVLTPFIYWPSLKAVKMAKISL
jgi:hypothetical protein